MLAVEKLLKERGVPYRLVELTGKSVSFEDVVRHAKGVDAEDNCKTVVARGRKGQLYAFMVRGMKRIDFGKVRQAIGEKVGILGEKELKEATDMEAGGICPLLLENARILVDEKVLERETIHFGSGDTRYSLEMRPADLDKAMEFEIVDIEE